MAQLRKVEKFENKKLFPGQNTKRQTKSPEDATDEGRN